MPKVVPAKKAAVAAKSPKKGGAKPYPLPHLQNKKRPLTASNYPPPPPPPPPPANNPYYQKFFEDYWSAHAKGFQVPGVMVLPGQANYGMPSITGLHNAVPPMVLPPPAPIPATRAGTLSMEEYPVKKDRQTYVMGAPNDEDNLSEKQCYVRTRLMEVFLAEKEDTEKSVRNSRAKFVGQVGLRCVFCVPAMDAKDRVERAICYPTATGKFYQASQDMQHFHFAYCPAVPPQVRVAYQELRTSMNHRRAGEDRMSPKEYWAMHCAEVGMVDSVGDDGKNNGVKLAKGHKMVERAKLPDYKKELFMPPKETEGKPGMAKALAKEVEEGGKGGFDKLVADLDGEEDATC
ncbi:hypothetical protein ACHAXT_012496 [Thalassiosira profunda]